MRKIMRGVKIDPELMSRVISDGINSGCVTMEDIISHTKNKVEELNKRIIEAEKLKVTRSKLSAIISSLEANDSENNKDERILSLFEIKDINMGEALCKKISESMVDSGNNFVIDPISSVMKCEGVNKFDWIYCLKDLCKHKVLINDGGRIYKGENFVDFLSFVANSDE